MIGSIPINVHAGRQEGKLTIIWCESDLDYIVYRDGKEIDRVGADYAEKNPEWRKEVAKKWQ